MSRSSRERKYKAQQEYYEWYNKLSVENQAIEDNARNKEGALLFLFIIGLFATFIGFNYFIEFIIKFFK